MGLTKTYKDGTKPVVAIIGTGFSGLCAAIRLQTQLDINSFTIFELLPDIGGTWWSNTYPGCACDVKSHNYAFSFEPNYDWSRAYAPQQEIWEYMRRTARKYELYDRIQFRTEVTHVEWKEDRHKWVLDYVNVSNGQTGQMEADIVFSGMGPLRIPNVPKEFEAFEGPKWHTAEWDHSYDLTNKRIAVVGSGASAVQLVPAIVDKVKTLEYYQRTASYLIPRNNSCYGAVWKWMFKRVPFFHFFYYKYLYYSSEVLIRVFSSKWQDRIPRALMACVVSTLRFIQVRDKVLREKLTPNYEIGCRRVVISSDYYPAMTRENINVHTDPIVGVKGNTLILQDGSEQEVDALVLATGFHTQTYIPKGFMIGKDGCDVHSAWGKTPSTYYGITSPETPNMFFLLGPNTNLGHNSILFMLESQVDYAIKAISHMMEINVSSLQVTDTACNDFMTELDEQMRSMVWSTSCHSWYQNEEGRVTSLWWSSCSHYWWRLRNFHPRRFIFGPERA